jgi:hypothetical protein
VKLIEISGKKKNIYKIKLMNLKIHNKIKNIRVLYRGINDFQKGYQPRTNIVKDEKGDLVTDSTVFWLGGGTISLSY